MDERDAVEQMAADLGGKIEDGGRLPDGSGWAVMSMPLPADHWLTREPAPDDPYEESPMPFRIGTMAAPDAYGRTREDWAQAIRAAAQWAIRGSTMNGRMMDFDPDAMVQNLVVGMLGYWTPDGTGEPAEPSVDAARQGVLNHCSCDAMRGFSCTIHERVRDFERVVRAEAAREAIRERDEAIELLRRYRRALDAEWDSGQIHGTWSGNYIGAEVAVERFLARFEDAG